MYRIKKIDYCNIEGEPEEFECSPLKSLFLSEDEAQLLAFKSFIYLKNKRNLTIPIITFSKRKTKHIFGSCFKDVVDPRISEIVIYDGHNSVHIILHEIVHMIYSKHNKKFENLQRELIEMWKTKWSKEI